MKKLTKTFMAVAAVSAVSAVMAASAMAMTATYADGTITLADVESTGTSQTLLVLSEDTTVTSENVDIVKQIDQKDDNTSFATVPVGSLADGTYYVRIGGNGEIQTATFTVGDVDPGDETKDILIGDVNSNGDIQNNDNVALTRYLAEYSSGIGDVGKEYVDTEGSKVIVGDVNSNGDIQNNDNVALTRYLAEYSSGIGNVGTTVKVKVSE